MKFKTSLLALVGFCVSSVSCQQHFISDAETRTEIHREFVSRQAVFQHGNVFQVFNGEMTVREREAMEFLYSSMMSADLGDYTGEYFLENVRMAFRAKDEMAWGKDIPEDLFRFFVLPVRVNNERLDNFRKTYYETLRKRVQGLSLHDAALEVNHWCHEHVTYSPSNARTLSPMACIVNALGRCGEESTLAVAAFRTIGIPARQVYTPRWAHTDDNHAWVEVWVDGRWQFLGACEPEPELNMAWFNQPASRAMLMHTRVIGNYSGNEDVIKRTKCYTEINVIDTYAPVRQSTVRVVDAQGKPVAGALVEFKIYNYAEFCSVVKLTANEHGEVALHSGLGDMLVWASHQGKFGFAKLNSEQLTVVLNHKQGDEFKFTEDIVPPIPGNIPVHATAQAIASNKTRLAQEDSIRRVYLSTFFHADKSDGYSDNEIKLLVEARGNWKNVKNFIDETEGGERARAIALLESLENKDLHDTSLDVFRDMLSSTSGVDNLSSNYVKYVLSPRITDEFIQPYRTQIRTELSKTIGNHPSVSDLIAWIKKNIVVSDEYNPIFLHATPAGVLRLRYADNKSRNRFFVAACRSYGIPSHMHTITGNPQDFQGDKWIEVVFDGNLQVAPKKGKVKILYDKSIVPTTPKPAYETHYTIARIDNGSFNTISVLPEQVKDNVKPGFLALTYNLDEGYYMLTTGNRMASGKVLAQSITFEVKEGKTCNVNLHIRPADNDIAVIGNMNPEETYLSAESKLEKSILSTTGRGYFLLAVVGTGDEPTNHALHGFASISKELQEWGRPFVVLSPSVADAAKFDRSLLSAMKVNYGIDIDGKVKSMLGKGCNSSSPTLPVIALCDSFGRIVYFSQGYNTSMAEQLKNVIHKL